MRYSMMNSDYTEKRWYFCRICALVLFFVVLWGNVVLAAGVLDDEGLIMDSEETDLTGSGVFDIDGKKVLILNGKTADKGLMIYKNNEYLVVGDNGEIAVSELVVVHGIQRLANSEGVLVTYEMTNDGRYTDSGIVYIITQGTNEADRDDLRYNPIIKWTTKWPKQWAKGTSYPQMKYIITYTSKNTGKTVTTSEKDALVTANPSTIDSDTLKVTFTASANVSGYFTDDRGITPATKDNVRNSTCENTYEFKAGSPENGEDVYEGWQIACEEDSSGGKVMRLIKYIGNETEINVPSTVNKEGYTYHIVLQGTGKGYYDPDEDEYYDNAEGTFPYGTRRISIAEGVELSNPKALFNGLRSLDTVTIGGWTEVLPYSVNCEAMFAGCDSLKSVDLSSCPMIFESIKYMFFGCSSIETVDISGLMGYTGDDRGSSNSIIRTADAFDGLLYGCDNLNTFSPYIRVNYQDFRETTAQKYPLEVRFVDNVYGSAKTMIGWGANTERKTYYRLRSEGVWKYAVIEPETDTVLLVAWETSEKNITVPATINVNQKIYSTVISGNFDFPEAVETIAFEDGVRTTRDAGRMFNDLHNLRSVNLKGLDTSSAEQFGYMFSGCDSLSTIDLSPLDTSGLAGGLSYSIDSESGMGGMFDGCESLREISFGENFLLGNSDGMFRGCSSLTGIDLSKVNTSLIGSRINTVQGVSYYGSMQSMFEGCTNLKSITFAEGFRLSSNLSHMFNGCQNLESIDLSKCEAPFFGMVEQDAYNYDSVDEMFKECVGLEVLDLSSIKLNENVNATKLVKDCISLKTFLTPLKPLGVVLYLPHTMYDAEGNSYDELSEDKIITGSIRLTKEKEEAETVEIKSISFRKNSYTVSINETMQLQIIILPENATNKTLFWNTSDDNVAMVDGFGIVTGVSNGVATITAVAQNGEKVATCIVTVVNSDGDDKVDKSGFDPGLNASDPIVDAGVYHFNVYMVKGQTCNFPATYGDIDHTIRDASQKVIWKSSDSKTASVSKKNKVKALRATSAASSIQIYDGTRLTDSTYVYDLHIIDPIITEKDSSLKATSVKVTAGDKVRLVLKGIDEYKDKYYVSWVSSNTEVASVDEGIVCTAKKGQAKISAYVGGQKYTCTVKVVDIRDVPKKVEDASTIKLSLLQSCRIHFSNPSFKANNVVWSSEDGTLKGYTKRNTLASGSDIISYYQNDILRVTGKGKIIAVGSGTTSVTATDNNGVKQTFNVVVPEPTVQTLYVNLNKVKQIKLYNVKTNNATWISSNTDIVNIVANGKVKGIKSGNALVTCFYDPYGTGKPLKYVTAVYVENPSLKVDSTLSKKGNGNNYYITLKRGDTYKLVLQETYQPVVFSSRNTSIAFVSENGIIEARGKGKTTLYTTINGKQIKVSVNVEE